MGEPLPTGAEAHAACLPRRKADSSPQGMTMTLLADYGLRTRVWIPSGAIVTLLGEFGVTPGSARAAISRLARRGMLESSRQGWHTSYRLTPDAATTLAIGGAAVAGFPSEAESWDGYWTLIAFSLPEGGDGPRRALRAKLRWLGFAPLYDALWVSPLDLPPGASQTFANISSGTIAVFRARRVEVGGTASRDPLDAWDLASVNQQYQAFIDRWDPILPRVRSGRIAGTEALHARTEVMDTYRHFLALDPRLPMRLMPPDWPRQQARRVFTSIYDGLMETAREHVADTVARFVDGPSPTISSHTVDDLLAGMVR
jgi:phenylacetic acid degradation operon negative regulatory protein